jgi:hypothetical protein
MTDVLEQRLLRLENQIDDSDWLDVRRRAQLSRRLRPSRRRVVLAAAAAAAVTLAVAPAFGVGGRLLDLVQGSPAPPEVKKYFASSEALRDRLFAQSAAARHRMRERFSPLVLGDARGVAAIQSADGPIYLWAAPTEDGRQCWLIQAGEDRATGRPYGAGSCDDANPPGMIASGTFWTDERPSIQIVHARVYDDAITRVDVELDGAEGISLPVASGHALGTVAKDARVRAFVGRDADGDVVARQARAAQ